MESSKCHFVKECIFFVFFLRLMCPNLFSYIGFQVLLVLLSLLQFLLLLFGLFLDHERVVFKHLYNHFRDDGILSSLQSRFIPDDSTTNQLTFLYNTFCQALDSGKEGCVVFCDVCKAFDRVWQKGLLCKLRVAGLSGSRLSWLSSYLSERRQRV